MRSWRNEGSAVCGRQRVIIGSLSLSRMQASTVSKIIDIIENCCRLPPDAVDR